MFISFFDHGDFDLIQRLHSCVTNQHVIRKIKAHQCLDAIPSLLDTYHALGNHLADKAAVDANRDLFPEVFDQLETHHQEHAHDMVMLEQLYELELALQRARAQSQDSNDMPQVVQNVPSKGKKTLLLQAVQEWQVVSDWNFPETITDTWLQYSAWGQQAAESLISWLRQCQWPSSDEGPGHQKTGISWAEVAVAVARIHGQWLPVKRKDANGDEILHQPTDDESARRMGITLSEQAENICYMLKHVRSLIPEDLTPDIPLGKVGSLMVYGFGAWTTGMKFRPSFPNQNLVCESLLDYIPGADSALSGLPTIHWMDESQQFDDVKSD